VTYYALELAGSTRAMGVFVGLFLAFIALVKVLAKQTVVIDDSHVSEVKRGLFGKTRQRFGIHDAKLLKITHRKPGNSGNKSGSSNYTLAIEFNGSGSIRFPESCVLDHERKVAKLVLDKIDVNFQDGIESIR